MPSNLLRYQYIVRERTQAFQQPITWFSNGERGHLHANAGCEKIRKSQVATLERKLTLAEALERTLCADCIFNRFGLTPEQQEVVSAADCFMEVEHLIGSCSISTLPESGNYPLIDRYRHNHYLRNLRRDVDRADPGNNLGRWAERLRESIDNLMVDEPESGQLNIELQRLAAVEVIRRGLQDTNAPSSAWGGPTVVQFFGQVAYRDWRAESDSNPLVWFANEWLRQVGAGRSPVEIRERVLGNPEKLASLFTFPKVESFKHLSDLTPPRAGENLHAYCMRIWAVRAAEEFTKAALHWEQELARLLAGTGMTILAVNKSVTTGRKVLTIPGSCVASAWQVAVTQPGGERAAICVSDTIADFLLARSSLYYGETRWEGSVKVETVPAQDVVEAALVLWDPYDRYSAYREFAEAYTAAAAL